ncbi:MAG TPA: hypothetical protein VF319_18070 [Caldimonas sp.]
MKIISKFVLAVAAAGFSVIAVAQSDQADMDRRARNRDEAIAHHQGMMQGESMQPRHEGMRERASQGARSTRNFTHRQMDKMRDFSDRQNRRHPGPAHKTIESDKSPNAIGK